MMGLSISNPKRPNIWPAPTVLSGAVQGGLTTALINITARSSLFPPSGVTGFSLTVNAVPITITSATISGTVITLNFAAVTAGLPALLTYAGGNVVDARNQSLTAFASFSISNP